jgi:hypothetical protein
MSTLTFARSKIVCVECPDESTFLAHGVLDDYVYALELDVEVKLPNFEVTSVQGRWKRYTTPECPKAIAKLQNAVGLCVPEKDFARKIRRVVGREGCTHFANLLIECCDGIMQAATYGEWKELEQKKAAPEKEGYLKKKFEGIPSLEDSCMVYSRGGK